MKGGVELGIPDIQYKWRYCWCEDCFSGYKADNGCPENMTSKEYLKWMRTQKHIDCELERTDVMFNSCLCHEDWTYKA